MARRSLIALSLFAAIVGALARCAGPGEAPDGGLEARGDDAGLVADGGSLADGGAEDAGSADAGDDASILERVALLLTGRFDSSAQAARDSSYFAVQLHTCPVEFPALGARVLYVEQALLTSLAAPYRQRFYVLAAPSEAQVVSAVYESTAANALIGLCDDPPEVRAERLPPAETVAHLVGCDVTLEETEDGFAGSTGDKTCPSTFNGATYVTSEVTLHNDRLLTWDRGFNDADVQVWGAANGPYEFIRQ